ncbi:MAG: tetratricopeptide repeat protein [Syntrophaceae bacterium]|nr:tetratricopeptide repeat protein [Syntrophaceae bacterium]
MRNKHRVCSLFPVIFFIALYAALAVPDSFCQDREPSSHNQQGLAYFKQGFYEHAPRNQGVEAERNYGLAIREFKAAISLDPFYTEAHRNLARVYYVQKNFHGAAEEYQRVTELDPGNLDAYVNLALSLIELNKLDEAIQALQHAKDQTSDPEALQSLETYISKVQNHKAKEVR